MHRSAARDWEEPELLSDLPHNKELEQALLGALLISNASYHRVSPLVTPADFYEPLHGRLFEAIGDLDCQEFARYAPDAYALLRRRDGWTSECSPISRTPHRRGHKCCER